MDILAHTLWANAGARAANAVAEKKNKKLHISPGWAAFWGVFPDLFAFTIPFALRFYYLLIGSTAFSKFFERPSLPALAQDVHSQGGFDIAHYLYNYSHSLVIWAVVFIIVWIIFKRPRYELLGWALHILIDIPSHILAFYPTPFLFPLSDYRFPFGIQWSNQWFMIINYCALLVVWGKIAFSNYRSKLSR